MEDCEGAVRIGEIADLLKASFAIVTGGRSRDGCPILTFPDRGNFSSLTAEDYRKLVIYLTAVPPLQDADLGFVVIIDRRTDRWSSVKTALLRINSFFPGLITVAYVLRPSGLLQKAISEVSNKFFREEFHFKVVVLSCLEELHHKIDASQLVPELGGYLSYDHKAWIETRVAVETFSANTCDISAGLRKFSRRLQDCEVPNDVPTIESLLTKQNQDYSSLKEELAKACRQGETLLQLIKDPGNAETLPRQPDPAQIVNITAIQRLLIQMEETEKTLEDFWSRHEAHLNLCLQLRRFELEFRELQGIFESNMKELSLLEQDGDNVAAIDSILEETLHFKNNCQVDLDRAAGLEDQAARLMANYGHNSALLDSVRPKSVEIQRMGHNLREMLTRRLENLHKSRDLYYRIEKVNMWCSQGIELLASQQLEKFASRDFTEQSLAEIESFLQSANELVQTDSKDFRAIFKDLVSPETKALIHQVLQRLEDVHIMCEKRATGLRRIALRLQVVRPIQPVPPEPVPAVPAQVRKVSTPEAETGRVAAEGSANAKLGHVLAELLDTERTYVSEIAIILKGYRDELLEDSRHVAPSLLVEKCDLLFGNLPEIGDFHGRVFLPDLERCASSTQLVARCFLQHSDILHELYSFYCQNIPQSEELRRQVGEQHPFFRECQQQLGHKLPLSAYLLKPVQRITKYQLLIRDLIKYSTGGDKSENSDLQAALDVMLAVLRCVNDSMHQVAISGYHGSLAELGRLLLQGGFSVWAEGKRDRLRELRLKPMQRHVFLYERGVVFCKRVGKDPDKATYQFKHVLKMSEVGLTETVHNGRGSDARKFELWLQGRQEVWVLQAPSRDVKETWTTEVKRVLLNQFHQLKGQTQQTTTRMGPHNYNPAYGPKLGPASAALPHKPLRQTTSWEYSPSTGSSSSGSDRNSVADSAIGSSSNSTTSCASKFVRSSTADEDDGWSTDFSLSDDEPGESYLERLESLRRRYIVLADYAPLGPTEAFLKEGDVVDLVRIGCAGWWYVRPMGGSGSSSQEGWAPSAYLEPCPSNVKSPCSSGTPSLSSHDSEHEPCAH